MSDFTKAKIGFAIALLATLFTIHPIIVSATAFSFILFSLPITLAWFYHTAMGLFSASVYLYALALLSDRTASVAERMGNILYACALLVPPLYLLLFLCSLIGRFVASLAPHIAANFWTGLISGVLSAVLGVTIVPILSRFLNRRDRESQAEILNREEDFRIQRVASTFQAGYYDFALIQASQAIELALRRALLTRHVPVEPRTFQGLVNAALAAGIVPSEVKDDLDLVRRMRNRAAHPTEPLLKEEAQEGIEKAQRILALINRGQEDSPLSD